MHRSILAVLLFAVLAQCTEPDAGSDQAIGYGPRLCGGDSFSRHVREHGQRRNQFPATDWVFSVWNGCDSTQNNACPPMVNSARSITAQFPPTSQLSVSRTGDGTIVSDDGFIICGATCSYTYLSGTNVVLTASPSEGWAFTGWSGCDQVEGAACSVIMNSARQVNAFFKVVYPLTVTNSGNGLVSSGDGHIYCGAVCQYSYADGAQVTLTATPKAGYTLGSWIGCNSVQGNLCTVTMSSAKNVSPNFTQVQIALTSLMLKPASVKGGNLSIATLTLSKPAPLGALGVGITSDQPLVVHPPDLVVIPGGRSSISFAVRTSIVRARTTASIKASASATQASATLNIEKDYNSPALMSMLKPSVWFLGRLGNYPGTGRHLPPTATVTSSEGEVAYTVVSSPTSIFLTLQEQWSDGVSYWPNNPGPRTLTLKDGTQTYNSILFGVRPTAKVMGVDGNYAYILDPVTPAIQEYDVNAGQMLKALPLTGHPTGFAVDPTTHIGSYIDGSTVDGIGLEGADCSFYPECHQGIANPVQLLAVDSNYGWTCVMRVDGKLGYYRNTVFNTFTEENWPGLMQFGTSPMFYFGGTIGVGRVGGHPVCAAYSVQDKTLTVADMVTNNVLINQKPIAGFVKFSSQIGIGQGGWRIAAGPDGTGYIAGWADEQGSQILLPLDLATGNTGTPVSLSGIPWGDPALHIANGSVDAVVVAEENAGLTVLEKVLVPSGTKSVVPTDNWPYTNDLFISSDSTEVIGGSKMTGLLRTVYE